MLGEHDEILASKSKPSLLTSSPKLSEKTESLINHAKMETARELGHYAGSDCLGSKAQARMQGHSLEQGCQIHSYLEPQHPLSCLQRAKM